MTIKEKPLIDAVSRLGSLPGFLFSNPIITGFFAMFMCPVFGAVFLFFQDAGRGGVNALELFDVSRIGAICGLIVGGVIFLGVLISAFRTEDEAPFRFQFVFGGVLCAAALLGLDHFFLESAREYFGNAGPLV